MSKDLTGDSTVQRDAEAAIRSLLEKDHGPLNARRMTIDEGASVEIDAVSTDGSVLIEIFARQGKLLDGQKKKLAKDILKLALIGTESGDRKRRLIIAHANPAIARHLTEESWVSCAARKFCIEERNLFDDLPGELKARIMAAQKVQAR